MTDHHRHLMQSFGRRPIYLITFLIFFAANLGLSFADTYWLLLLLRIVQATGACSAIAIGAGSIADVTERKERGGYMGFYAFAQFTGPAIGPVIGGILSQKWDYHATFFFLTALSGLFLIFMALFLVETLRTLVGNGSLQPYGIYRALLSPTGKADALERRNVMKDPLEGKLEFGFAQPFLVFLRLETMLAILAFSVVYATYYLSAGSLSYLLKEEYGLSELLIGVCYLPSGVGCAIGTVLGGKILDWTYRRALDRKGVKVMVTRVRLESAWVYMPGYAISMLAYGWCVRAHTNLAAPLVFQFTRERVRVVGTAFLALTLASPSRPLFHHVLYQHQHPHRRPVPGQGGQRNGSRQLGSLFDGRRGRSRRSANAGPHPRRLDLHHWRPPRRLLLHHLPGAPAPQRRAMEREEALEICNHRCTHRPPWKPCNASVPNQKRARGSA